MESIFIDGKKGASKIGTKFLILKTKLLQLQYTLGIYYGGQRTENRSFQSVCIFDQPMEELK